MTDLEDEKYDLMEKYNAQFGQLPPVWKMQDEEAIRQMKIALQTGVPMRGLTPVLPDDTVM